MVGAEQPRSPLCSPIHSISVDMEPWTKQQRSFAVKAFYQSGSYEAARRRFRAHFQINRNRPVPSVNSIKL